MTMNLWKKNLNYSCNIPLTAVNQIDVWKLPKRPNCEFEHVIEKLSINI